MKEEQKIFNYHTLWDNLLKNWYYELYYYHNEYLKTDFTEEFYERVETYLKKVDKELYNMYGYETLNSFLEYTEEDLLKTLRVLGEDDDLLHIYKDYNILTDSYLRFHALLIDCIHLF